MPKALAVVLSALTLAFAASAVDETHGKNNATFEESKIVGGLVTDITTVPSQVAVLLNDDMICSGHIIDPKVVVTAAHCCANTHAHLFKIRSGSNYYEMHGRVVAVVRVTIHSDFVMRRALTDPDFDIALMFLAASATAYGIPAKPIKLWNAGTVFHAGTLATLAGWGLTKEDSTDASPHLRSVHLPIVTNEDCAIYWKAFVRPHNVCAGYSIGGRGGCRGDSGAGLVILDKLAAINSFAEGCARPLVPAVFSSVPAFRYWIWENSGI